MDCVFDEFVLTKSLGVAGSGSCAKCLQYLLFELRMEYFEQAQLIRFISNCFITTNTHLIVFLRRFSDDYCWKISLWSDCDNRVSSDITLPLSLTKKDLMVFFNTTEMTSTVFLFVNLLHR